MEEIKTQGQSPIIEEAIIKLLWKKKSNYFYNLIKLKVYSSDF